MKKILGKNLNARPVLPEPNDVFVDLSTDKSYVFEDGTWQEIPVTAPVRLPAVTAEDAGKVLTVSAEGTWVAAALPTEE